GARPHTIELIKTAFFRERRAYLVGRAVARSGITPLVIALVSAEDGVRADAVITEVDQVSLLFSYTRSY
ncbi:MAG: bifunctional isocitrate dehydrogenase kinase/phosphatase, partial [Xanthomonadales bacterium]|nr:bifunctional isocitrate dehydrogenase kinase/phosphatase [Xanthomonadales bacterium]